MGSKITGTVSTSPISTEGTTEFIWCIPDYRAVISKVSSMSRATRDFSLTSQVDMTYNWQLGYRPVNSYQFSPYLKFISPSAKASDVFLLEWRLFSQSESNDGWKLCTKFKPDKVKSMAEYPEQTLTTTTAWESDCKSFVTDEQGTLTWKCQLVFQIKVGPPSTAQSNFNTASLTHLQNDFAMLLENGDMADLKIVCSDGVELKAHKLILSCRNPVFTSMLTADMVEGNTGVVELKDISSVIMKLLLHFLYTGELQKEWRQLENIVEFTYAAGKYQLKDVLKLLDESLGTFFHGKNNLLPLISLTSKLGLETAEMELLKRASETVKQAKNAGDFFRVMKNWGEFVKEL